MRAPGAVSGAFALESAIDELAYKLKIDPLEFRIKNYAEKDPETGKHFSSKALMNCFTKGRARLWLGKAKTRTAFDARRKLACRLGNGDRTLGRVSNAGFDIRSFIVPTELQMSEARPPTSVRELTRSLR